MTSKKIVRKKAPKKVVVPRVTPHAELDPEENERAKNSPIPSGPPKIHAKTVQVIFSVGTWDRENTVENFIAELQGLVQPVPFTEDGEPVDGTHMTVTSAHYILDGKVCMPEDYDEKTQQFKKGTYPPSWAGGPSVKELSIKAQLDKDFAELSSDGYDKKYGLGKFAEKPDMSKIITPEMQRVAKEQRRLDKLAAEDAALEEIDWEEVDGAADKSTSRAIKKMKTKKRVVKKAAPTKNVRKVIRKGKG